MRIGHNFICANCGEFASDEDETLDSGTTLVCAGCGKETVVLLCTPHQYVVAVQSIRVDEKNRSKK